MMVCFLNMHIAFLPVYVYVQVESEGQHNELLTLQADSVRLHKLIRELQMDASRLKQRQDALQQQHPHVLEGNVQVGTREASLPISPPDHIVLDGAAGENFIGRGKQSLSELTL
jgi:hypothetical protein